MAALMVSQAGSGDPGDAYVTDRSLWLTADRERVVEDGDPDAAFLLATTGKRIPRQEAERFGLVKAARKQAEPDEDKQAEKPENKGRRGRRGDAA